MGRGNRRGHKRKPGRCSTCKGPVAGHIGRPGKTCKNLPVDDLIQMATQNAGDNPQIEQVHEKDNDNANDDEVENYKELKGITLGMQACMEVL